MRKISISLHGADSSHHHKMTRRTSRKINFPNGIDYIITLEGIHWERLHHLETLTYEPGEVVYDLAEVIDSTWCVAKDLTPETDAEFAERISSVFGDTIRCAIETRDNRMRANDNGEFDPNVTRFFFSEHD